ncbi:hypothetical protein ACPA2N_26035 [Ectopseudomonas hydrolytica]|uniref:hypothetical protein n=1 Tax=Ectopseudomonas hydrolytica TaxID=2493633 RepID=UPI003C2EDFD2
MAARRPIVSVSGRRRQLPEGDSLAGVPLAVPVYQSAGTLLRVALQGNGALAVGRAVGGDLSVQVMV